MHTQCREKTKDIDHTFQMVGGQSSVHVKLVTSEVHMEKWVSLHSVHQMLPSHQTLANKHIYTHMIYHRKLTLVYGMKCCMGIWAQPYGEMERGRRRPSMVAIYGPHASPSVRRNRPPERGLPMRTQASVPQSSPCMRRWPDDPHEKQDDKRGLGLQLGLWSQEHGLLVWKLSHLPIVSHWYPQLLSSHLSSDDTTAEPSHGSLSYTESTIKVDGEFGLLLWKGENLARINYLGNTTVWHARGMTGRSIFAAKGGGLDNMDGNKPSRLCLTPSQAPGAPSHGQALQIQASCTHHTVWCWHWCSQAYLWPHRYSCHNPSLRHWRKSKWICGLCSQSSLHPGQWLTCSRRKHYWSGPTVQRKQQVLKEGKGEA